MPLSTIVIIGQTGMKCRKNRKSLQLLVYAGRLNVTEIATAAHGNVLHIVGIFIGSHHETFVGKHIRNTWLASVGCAKQASPNFGISSKHACILSYRAQLLHKIIYLAFQSLHFITFLPHFVHIVTVEHLQLFHRLCAVNFGIIVAPYVEEQCIQSVEKLEVLVKIGYLPEKHNAKLLIDPLVSLQTCNGFIHLRLAVFGHIKHLQTEIFGVLPSILKFSL